MSAMRAEALNLYRQLIRSSKKFSNYNFREYALRRTREDFKENKNFTDPEKVMSLITKGKEDLVVVARQATVSSLYSPDKGFIMDLIKKGSL